MNYRELVEPYWNAVSIHVGADKFTQQFAALPRASQHLYATHWTQSEVQNGGLGQFFDNGAGILAPEAVEGFRTLGMPEAAAALADVMRLFGDPYPRERKTGEQVTLPRTIEDRFSKLLESEAGGFWDAADRYAATHTT
ncbi:MAG: DUF4375 domain-containing protein [Brevundimonas sp.]|uniref:DMP19 family protein n=1 Tax=Brevundimonas sp. TaxID=1871086 RepID=UPI00391C672F